MYTFKTTYIFIIYNIFLFLYIVHYLIYVFFLILVWYCIRGLHRLKTEAWTRPVPEIVWPDPTRAAQLNLEPEPEPKSPPSPPTQRITQKKRKKVAFHDCMQRNRLIKALPFHKHLPVMKFVNIRVQRSHTFCRGNEFVCTEKIMTRANYGHFCQLRLVSILSTLNHDIRS